MILVNMLCSHMLLLEDDSVTVSDGTFTWDTTERPNLNE